MNLETRLPAELWEAVRINYEKRNFTGAVLDAFYFLSDLLRKKSGAEGDGSSLIGHAFGGVAPKIKLNKLQSESEWNVQKGVEQLLRGFYQAVRNPRSHEKTNDTEEDAQTLITFIGYLVRHIDQAKAQFSRQDFIKRVLDPDFVPQKRYAELLVDEIPIGQRLDVFLDVYRSKEGCNPDNLRQFFDALLVRFVEDERKQIDDVISEELKMADDENTIRQILGSFSGDVWPRLDEVARLRIENKLVRSIRDGRYDQKQQRCRSGGLATWAIRYLPNFLLKEEVLRAVSEKLRSNNTEEEDYVFAYLLPHLKAMSDQMPKSMELTFRTRLEAGNSRFHTALLVGEPWDSKTWTDKLAKAYENFKAAEPANDQFSDDIPF